MRQFILLLLILVPTLVYVGYMLSTRQSFDRLKRGRTGPFQRPSPRCANSSCCC